VAALTEQDQQHIADVQRRRNLGMSVHPSDAFPAASWTSHRIYKTREHARRHALERDKHRYEQSASR
jgi:hypothetical protein